MPGKVAPVTTAEFIKDTVYNILKEIYTAIAEILKSQCSERAKAFRYGGEEFGMILYDYTQELTFDLIENIRQMIYLEKFSFMPDRHCSISAGIYQYNGEDMSSEEVFEKADKAMYQAKQNGRNRTVCADI